MALTKDSMEFILGNTNLTIEKNEVHNKLPTLLLNLLDAVEHELLLTTISPDATHLRVVELVDKFSLHLKSIVDFLNGGKQVKKIMGNMLLTDFIIAASTKGVLKQAIPGIREAVNLGIATKDWEKLNETLDDQLVSRGNKKELTALVDQGIANAAESANSIYSKTTNQDGEQNMSIEDANANQEQTNEVKENAGANTANTIENQIDKGEDMKTTKTTLELSDEFLGEVQEKINKDIDAVIEKAGEEIEKTFEKIKDVSGHIKEAVEKEIKENRVKVIEETESEIDWKEVAMWTGAGLVVGVAGYVAYDYLFGDKVDTVVFNDAANDFIGGAL